jgi:hypothetical protein
MSAAKNVRCVYCLKVTDSPEWDHVPAKSWYPTSTPPTVQRWTVPSCPECNRKYGQLEQDLLIRMVLCLDSDSEAARGLDERVFAAMGLDVTGLSLGEKAIRDGLRAKIRSEFIPHDQLADMQGRIPGVGPGPDEPQGPGILVPWAGLAMIAEKIARGCEYRYKNQRRYVEHPYGVLVQIVNGDTSQEPPWALFGETLDFGPGCQIIRGETAEDPRVVRYLISLWGCLHLKVLIEYEEYLIELEKQLTKPGGVLPSQDRPAMQVPEYLRRFN